MGFVCSKKSNARYLALSEENTLSLSESGLST